MDKEFREKDYSKGERIRIEKERLRYDTEKKKRTGKASSIKNERNRIPKSKQGRALTLLSTSDQFLHFRIGGWQVLFAFWESCWKFKTAKKSLDLAFAKCYNWESPRYLDSADYGAKLKLWLRKKNGFLRHMS